MSTTSTPRTDEAEQKEWYPPALITLARQLETELAAMTRERDRLNAELNWQSRRNSGQPTKGGFEFYINEEWTGLATAALDTDYGWNCALRKHRLDPDDERVRVRRVIEDDEILKALADKATLVEALKEIRDGGLSATAAMMFAKQALQKVGMKLE